MRSLDKTCRVEADVAAPVDAVWRVVVDVTRTGEWSHECHTVEWLDGAGSAVPGARFRGGNTSFLWRWHRISEVTAAEPGRLLEWRTVPTRVYVDSTVWRIVLEPHGTGTRIVQTYQVVRCPRWWELFVVYGNPPHRDRAPALAADLRRIGEVAVADLAAAPAGTRSPS